MTSRRAVGPLSHLISPKGCRGCLHPEGVRVPHQRGRKDAGMNDLVIGMQVPGWRQALQTACHLPLSHLPDLLLSGYKSLWPALERDFCLFVCFCLVWFVLGRLKKKGRAGHGDTHL
ncbi:mCG148066 [Mus musculus]|nr:mCG148066 [Mus musculus]